MQKCADLMPARVLAAQTSPASGMGLGILSATDIPKLVCSPSPTRGGGGGGVAYAYARMHTRTWAFVRARERACMCAHACVRASAHVAYNLSGSQRKTKTVKRHWTAFDIGSHKLGFAASAIDCTKTSTQKLDALSISMYMSVIATYQCMPNIT